MVSKQNPEYPRAGFNIAFAALTVLALILGNLLTPVTRTQATTELHIWWVNGALGADDIGHGTGPGSLAFKTIQHALNTAASGDYINVAGISDATPDHYDETLTVSKSVTIIGGSPDTTWLTPTITSGPVIQLSAADINVGIRNIRIDASNYASDGTGEGGCISATGDNLTLQDVVLCTGGYSGPGYGGGLYVKDCNLTMNGCIVRDCYARLIGGGLYSEDSTVNLADCFFYSNTASGLGGGAIAAFASSLTAENCTLYNNRARNYDGGAIFSDGRYGNSTIALSNCTLYDNYADRYGGGIGLPGYSSTISLSLTCCTLYRNSVYTGGRGGGLYQAGDGCTTTLSNCIFDNYRQDRSGETPVEIADNIHRTGSVDSMYSLYSDSPSLSSNEANLFNTPSLCYKMAAVVGTTPTCAIDSASQARGHGSILPLPADQRGVSRPALGACDIGAYQWVGPTYASTSGSDTNNGLSPATPKQHIYAAVDLAGPGSECYVAAGTYADEYHHQDWRLPTEDSGYANIMIYKPLTLIGAGKAVTTIMNTVSYYGTIVVDDPVCWVRDNAAVSISGLTLDQASPVSSGAYGIYARMTAHSDDGAGRLLLQDCIIKNNALTGLRAYKVGDITLSRCTFENNGEGGLYAYRGSRFLADNCTFTGNTSDAQGAGLLFWRLGNATVSNCTISNNLAGDIGGGGLYSDNSTVYLANTTVYGNRATGTSNGGGILNGGIWGRSDINIQNCTVSANYAAGEGGGLYEDAGNTAYFKNTILAYNWTADNATADIGGDASAVNSQGHNICTTDAGRAFFSQATDNVSTNPGLGPLQDNGGPTFTCAIGPTSPACNTAAEGPSADQRGYFRPALGGYDVGAYELQPVIPPTPAAPTVTSVVPASGQQGQTLTVTITGTNFTDATAVSFGAGITVTFTVNSSTQITATIVIDPGATTGARDVSVTTPGGAGTVAGMFTVTQSRQFIGSGPHGGNTGTSGLPGQQGTIGLPNIIVQSASISTASPAPGQAVTITANVANRGTTNGTTAVRVYVNGQEEAAQGVTLNSGSNKSIYFTISRSEPGAYMVYVGGTPAGSFTVGQAAGPDIILAISSLLVLAALVLSLVYVSRRRQRYYR